MPIPIIDLFAGPGGLGEGFSSILDNDDNRVFQIKLSIEKDPYAHQTLRLRSFFRKFPEGKVPSEYYEFVRGDITLNELYTKYPEQFREADEEAWCATLGTADNGDPYATTNEEIDRRIVRALNGQRDWVLIGGPPCQAYSLVGRSRRQETVLDEDKDKRVGLYKEYLRIIAEHSPAVFVMENVKGLLSAKTIGNESIFSKILTDLRDPTLPFVEIVDENRVRYHVYSLSTLSRDIDLHNNEPVFSPQDYLIKSENYGVPQKRHRVILLGIRTDINVIPDILIPQEVVTLRSVIGGLPKLRSGITRSFDSAEWIVDHDGKRKKKRNYTRVNDTLDTWKNSILEFDRKLSGKLENQGLRTRLASSLGKEFIHSDTYDFESDTAAHEWFYDSNLKGISHHVSRKHLLQDIYRYYFAAKFTQERGTFPKMVDYAAAGKDLLPDHENATSGKFNDRFRVQQPDDAATTVTSHISKDGHYFIHYDPLQARSLTVREAARIQTFPDNYYFYGGRTQQYHQVGNAVPPYLAYQIGIVVNEIFEQMRRHNGELLHEELDNH
ncbi:DNA cytosine methyltransferase [Sphingobacterium sp. UT-1RO-CII-1]|uniref:DNA cytosine methyltransferase n=1 Tax=Sphingobacterium sp. UT-1RO-CII-1 TaxID=2995225 RepID=UPI00227C3CD1|nr:DNA cytosine methyltransferase [Sphingobacterium sp. UT-1RO-CII-1]MCY4780367.1 DNA cytosine methyltransferase [Sphingobacterium sp. UT-1RO-CII-1]